MPSVEDTLKQGGTVNSEQWAQLKSEGWTVDAWNAEMDSRRRENRSNRWMFAMIIVGVIIGAIAFFTDS